MGRDADPPLACPGRPELQARSIAGCVSVRKRDGVVVGEYHYYDNRLAMSLLTRLDRLAEKEAASDAHLRALSEELDGFIDCLASGGDGDSFVEERRPREPEPTLPNVPEPDDDPELTKFARLAGCSDYRKLHPFEIEVLDLDTAATTDWSADQWVRAFRSGFLTWVEIVSKHGDAAPGPGSAYRFHFSRLGQVAAADASDFVAPDAADPEIDTSDLDCGSIWDWTDEQLARAWRSGVLQRLPIEFWDGLADRQFDQEPPE